MIDKDRERQAFEELNRRLERENLKMTVTCVGGFVLSHHGMRATQDIDGFYEKNKKIEKLIRETGEKLKLNNEDEMWLNDSVSSMNPEPPEEICEKVYEFSNLTVLMPPLEYVAGMKLVSARERDVDDVAAIIKRKAIDSPDDLIKTLNEYGFDYIDEDLLLESFGRAYGMQWLEDYYIKNEEEINKRIKEVR